MTKRNDIRVRINESVWSRRAALERFPEMVSRVSANFLVRARGRPRIDSGGLVLAYRVPGTLPDRL